MNLNHLVKSLEQQYLEAMAAIMRLGHDKANRTKYAARACFGVTLRGDVRSDFPLLTTKKMAWDSVVGELIGFIRGVTSARDFRQLGCKVWDENANHPEKGKPWVDNPFREGEDALGRIYGDQWRRWRSFQVVDTVEQEKYLRALDYLPIGATDDLFYKEIDQLAELVHKLRYSPNDRRMIVSAWNPGDLSRQALPPCHMLFQCVVLGNRLNLAMTQRSADWFLGVPFNIASYALLLHLLASITGFEPGELKIDFTDAHIYHNHFDQVREQLLRKPYDPPTLSVTPRKELWDYTKSDIVLEGYEHHPAIKAEMA